MFIISFFYILEIELIMVTISQVLEGLNEKVCKLLGTVLWHSEHIRESAASCLRVTIWLSLIAFHCAFCELINRIFGSFSRK